MEKADPKSGALMGEAAELNRMLAGDPDPRDTPEMIAVAGAQVAAAELAAPAAIPLAQELAGVAAIIGTTLGSFFPSVKPVLDDAKCAELGVALAPVIEKYGLQRYLVGFAWRVELQAALVVVPTVLAVRAAIVADIAAKKPAPAPAESAPSSPAEPPIYVRGELWSEGDAAPAPAAAPPFVAPPGFLQPIERPAPPA